MKKILIYGDEEILVNYKNALVQCGAQPVFRNKLLSYPDCAGLLLPGGGDIHPALFGQPIGDSHQIDLPRDEAELALIRLFSVTNRPILGICKGLQILNVAFGGTLQQDIPTSSTHKWEENTGDKVHPVTASPGSFLAPLYGEHFSVNSAHHQGILSLGEGLCLSAAAEDGVVEAVECPEKKIWAVQWHPERMAFSHARPDAVDGRILLDFFLEKC